MSQWSAAWANRGGYRWWLLAAPFVVALVVVVTASSAAGASTSVAGGRLVVTVSGLPSAQRPVVLVRGSRTHRRLRSHRLVLRGLKPGRYVVSVRSLRVAHASASVKAGARALPKSRRIVAQVKPGRTTRVDAAYGTVINPGVHKLPSGLLRVVGDSANPSGLVYAKQSHVPAVGALVVAGTSSRLPDGLVARVTKSRIQGSERVLSIVNLPLSAAVPEFSYSGAINLHQASAASRYVSAASPCGPKLFNVGASLDQLQIRQASAKIFPRPELSLELAARTTEHVGAAEAALSVSCTWTLATLGPWRGEIPTPIVPIPVYAEIPLTASATIGVSLNAFQINLASTHDMKLDLGHYNHFALQEQGSNTWTSGTPGWSGQAGVAVNLGVQVGVGDPKVANFHLDVGVGAQAKFATNQTCELDLIPGTLDAGVKLGPLSGSLNVWSATPYPLWHGCTGSGGGGGATVTVNNPGSQTSVVGSPVSLQIDATDSAGKALDYTASGLPPGLTINSHSGLISGTPTTPGATTVTLTVTDSGGNFGKTQFGWIVGSAGGGGVSTSAVEASLPANASVDPSVRLRSVSCPSPRDCSAVGSYTDTAGYEQGLLLTETDGSWARGIEPSLPDPSGSPSNREVNLASVSCPSPGNCSAVGTYTNDFSTWRLILLNETDGAWAAPINASLPANAGAEEGGADANNNYSISCPSAGNCSAVGFYWDSSGGREGLLLRESDGTWQPGIEASPPADAATNPNVVLNDVSCPSAGNCVAVGEYADGTSNVNNQGIVFTETNGSWAPGVEASLPANADTANGEMVLFSVSCGSAGNCAAVGGYSDSSDAVHPLLLDEANGVWATGVEAQLPANAAPIVYPDGEWIDAVSCPSVGECSAYGSYIDSSKQDQGLLLSETDGTWKSGVEASMRSPFVFNNVSFNSLSCGTPGNCTIAGNGPLLVNEVAGSWEGGVVAALPANARTSGASLYSISCSAAETCTAVGSYSDDSATEQGLIVTETPASATAKRLRPDWLSPVPLLN